jgi:hypothetical protein
MEDKAFTNISERCGKYLPENVAPDISLLMKSILKKD